MGFIHLRFTIYPNVYPIVPVYYFLHHLTKNLTRLHQTKKLGSRGEFMSLLKLSTSFIHRVIFRNQNIPEKTTLIIIFGNSKYHTKRKKIPIIQYVFKLTNQVSFLDHKSFLHVYIQIKKKQRIWLIKGLPLNLTGLETPCIIIFLTKATKIPSKNSIGASKPPQGSLLRSNYLYLRLKSSMALHQHSMIFVL